MIIKILLKKEGIVWFYFAANYRFKADSLLFNNPNNHFHVLPWTDANG
jgi:hypothetical protein